MNRKTYRMCLVMLIVLAALSGICYYRFVMKHELNPKDGLFVKQVWTGREMA